MKWNFIINGAPLGSGDHSGGYAPRKKEWVQLALAGASLAASIFGGASAAKQQREAERVGEKLIKAKEIPMKKAE